MNENDLSHFGQFRSFALVVRKNLIKLSFVGLLILFTAGLAEVGGRLYLMAEFETGFSSFESLIWRYYYTIPVIRKDIDAAPEDQFSVLMLGGSVLYKNNGNIEEELERQLTYHLGKGQYKLYNAAIPGHSSMDSFLKTELLQDRHFDLILFYHGINEVRANNCPDDVFKEDYTHYAWYDETQCAVKHLNGEPLTIMPFLFAWTRVKARQKSQPERYVPRDLPKEQWMEEGSKLKTPPVFRKNLQEVVDFAARTDSRLLVPSFAYYLDPAYNKEDYLARKLSYNPATKNQFAVETWGLPKNVVAGIDAHNQMIDEVMETSKIQFFDMDSALPDTGVYFDDICHLSDSGSVRFVELLMPQILAAVSYAD